MTGIEYQTFDEFHTRLKTLVAPEGVGEALQDVFRNEIANALADLQTLIPWTRGFNVDVFKKNDVDEFCAASVFQGPVGKITQLFAYRPGRECKKFYYKRVSTAKMDCWVEDQRCVQCTFTPPPPNIYDTPYCNYVICGETACSPPYLTADEDDCKFKALDDDSRIFAIGADYKVYAGPRFPCGYYLLMQWQGIKRKWNDGDLVPVDQQIQECIVNRVEKKVAMKERAWDAVRTYDAEYAICLRTLRFRYHDEQDPEMKRDCTAAIEQLLPSFAPLYTYGYPACYVPVTGCVAPDAPTNLSVTAPGISELDATWTDNAIGETSYELRHRNITQALAFVSEPALPADSTSLNFFVSGPGDNAANDGDLIEVQVRAVNGDCASDWVSFQVNIVVNN